MLLLVTILLVVVGTISLVIGYTQSETTLILVSIGCSVVAGALLLIFTRMTAKTQKSDSSSGSAAPQGFAPSERTEAVPAMAGTGFLGRSSPEDTFAADAGDGGGTGGAALARYEDDEPSVDDDFPIDRYDSRRVGELLPLLAELDVDELDVVREHEERGKGRATVLARIDQLIDQLEAEDRDESEHRFDAPAADDHADDHADDDDHDEVRPTAPPVRVAALPMDDDYFPIEDYDDLRASEILPLLPELDDDELDMVRDRERTGSARSSILHRIDALLEVEPATAGPGPVPHEDVEPEPEPVAVPSAPVRKARATKAPATRAPATRAPATRAPAVKAPAARTAKATPVKAAVAKAPSKAPRVTKAAPAVRADRASAPVAKAPARKAPGGRASLPTTSVKAAAPAKVAKAPAQKRTASPSSTPASKTTKKAAKR